MGYLINIAEADRDEVLVLGLVADINAAIYLSRTVEFDGDTEYDVRVLQVSNMDLDALGETRKVSVVSGDGDTVRYSLQKKLLAERARVHEGQTEAATAPAETTPAE